MELLDVYKRYELSLGRAQDCSVFDADGREYLDFYGGHGVISIGHSHPHYVKRVSEQLSKIAFYSNVVLSAEQDELAARLGQVSDYQDFRLFLCNSGAEAVENAVKIASFANGRRKLVALRGSFHGRTSLAAGLSDNAANRAPVNRVHDIAWLDVNDVESIERVVDETVCAAVVEGIQGIAGVFEMSQEFLSALRARCTAVGASLIIDEVQSGFGRTGKFFAHQHSAVRPDLISMAKGMGNGFPVAGVLVAPHFESRHGMLGTTFGGNYLACVAASAVLEVMDEGALMSNAEVQGRFLEEELGAIQGVVNVRGKGLMLAVELSAPCGPLRSSLLAKHRIFTGSATCPKTIRLLPPLSVTRAACERLIWALTTELHKVDEN